MAVITLNREAFEKAVGKLTEDMQERIALFGTPIEHLDEKEIQIEIFPNRPDLLSLQGYTRAFRAFLGKDKGLKKYKVTHAEKNEYITVEKAVKDVRPCTACAIVKGLQFDDRRTKEIIDLQEKLHSTLGRKRKKLGLGIYPLEKINFPIRYTAREPDKIKFIPLGFKDEMSGLQILQRHPTGRAYTHLLAGKSHFPIFIDSQDTIMSMPPIINGELMGKIDETTKNVFIECTGMDMETIHKCLNIFVTTLADMGGTICALPVKYSDKKITTLELKPEKMKLDIEKANKILGTKLKDKEIKDALERMGFNYDIKKKIADIPAWRTDILHEIDLIEDIAIAYGYENFIPEIPAVSTIGKEDQHERLKRKIAEILAGLQFLEVSNYHLTTKEDQYKKTGEKLKEKKIKKISDAKTQYNLLRENIMHYLLKNFSENVDAEYPQYIFEMGRVFPRTANEEEHLAIAMAPGNFTQLKQTLEYLKNMLNLNLEVQSSESVPEYYIEGRVGNIMLDNIILIGHIGEVHPRVLRNWKIKMPVALLEIDLEAIFNKLR